MTREMTNETIREKNRKRRLSEIKKRSKKITKDVRNLTKTRVTSGVRKLLSNVKSDLELRKALTGIDDMMNINVRTTLIDEVPEEFKKIVGDSPAFSSIGTDGKRPEVFIVKDDELSLDEYRALVVHEYGHIKLTALAEEMTNHPIKHQIFNISEDIRLESTWSTFYPNYGFLFDKIIKEKIVFSDTYGDPITTFIMGLMQIRTLQHGRSVWFVQYDNQVIDKFLDRMRLIIDVIQKSNWNSSTIDETIEILSHVYSKYVKWCRDVNDWLDDQLQHIDQPLEENQQDSSNAKIPGSDDDGNDGDGNDSDNDQNNNDENPSNGSNKSQESDNESEKSKYDPSESSPDDEGSQKTESNPDDINQEIIDKKFVEIHNNRIVSSFEGMESMIIDNIDDVLKRMQDAIVSNDIYDIFKRVEKNTKYSYTPSIDEWSKVRRSPLRFPRVLAKLLKDENKMLPVDEGGFRNPSAPLSTKDKAYINRKRDKLHFTIEICIDTSVSNQGDRLKKSYLIGKAIFELFRRNAKFRFSMFGTGYCIIEENGKKFPKFKVYDEHTLGGTDLLGSMKNAIEDIPKDRIHVFVVITDGRTEIPYVNSNRNKISSDDIVKSFFHQCQKRKTYALAISVIPLGSYMELFGKYAIDASWVNVANNHDMQKLVNMFGDLIAELHKEVQR